MSLQGYKELLSLYVPDLNRPIRGADGERLIAEEARNRYRRIPIACSNPRTPIVTDFAGAALRLKRAKQPDNLFMESVFREFVNRLSDEGVSLRVASLLG